jgi:hypothetical protein
LTGKITIDYLTHATFRGLHSALVMQKVESSKHTRPYIKSAHSTGHLTASISLVVISVQLEGLGLG